MERQDGIDRKLNRELPKDYDVFMGGKMRRLSVAAVVAIFCASLVVCFSGPAPAQAAEAPAKSKAVSKTDPASSARSNLKTPPANAVKGGVLKCIRAQFPKNMSFTPEFSPTDSMFALPFAERLVDWDEKGNLVPQLATSWEGDPKAKTVTWHLRKGVTFHDGTPFNAEAVKWNFQMSLDAGRLYDGQFVKSLDVVDDHTLRMNLTEYTSMAFENYGWTIMFSPSAFKANGGKEWARTHEAGTGPFKLVDFKRDTSIRYERYDGYWRKGLPLLDAIEVRYVADPMTASLMMGSKDADVWLDTQAIKNVLDLQQKGLKINWGPGMFWALLPNSANPKSPYANKKVREAVECALDRPAMAKMLGFGRFEPLAQLVPSASPAFMPAYNPRPYNPDRAKKLLAEAGYPNGFETKLLAIDYARDAAVAVQGYLAAVGIKVNVDIADLGRYYGALFGPTGWEDLAIARSGINPDATDLFVHWGPRPMTYRFGFIAKSPEFLAACEKALKTYDQAGIKAAMQQAVRQGGDDAMVIPLFRSGQANVMQDYVHSDYVKIHSVSWVSAEDWMEKKK
jgi:peptide/nickel transport system substrate-binding protein